MQTTQSLPETLQNFQQKNNLTQHAIANLLGVSQSTYNNWINRKVPIDYKHYPIIAKICQVDISAIIPDNATVKLSPNTATEYSTTVNAIELYHTFTAPLLEMIEMLRNEIKEKDARIEHLLEELKNTKAKKLTTLLPLHQPFTPS